MPSSSRSRTSAGSRTSSERASRVVSLVRSACNGCRFLRSPTSRRSASLAGTSDDDGVTADAVLRRGHIMLFAVTSPMLLLPEKTSLVRLLHFCYPLVHDAVARSTPSRAALRRARSRALRTPTPSSPSATWITHQFTIHIFATSQHFSAKAEVTATLRHPALALVGPFDVVRARPRVRAGDVARAHRIPGANQSPEARSVLQRRSDHHPRVVAVRSASRVGRRRGRTVDGGTTRSIVGLQTGAILVASGQEGATPRDRKSVV